MTRRIGQNALFHVLASLHLKGARLPLCVKKMSSLARFGNSHPLVQVCCGAVGRVGNVTWHGRWCTCRRGNREQQGYVMNRFMWMRVATFVPGLETIMGRVVQTVTFEFRILIKVEKGMGHGQVVSPQAQCSDHKTTTGSHSSLALW